MNITERVMQVADKKLGLGVLGVILFLLITALVIWQNISPSKFVIVDMKRVLNQPAVLLSRSNMSEKNQTQLLMKYSAALPGVLASYGKIHRVTLISASVIVSGSFDITDIIIEQTFERLKHYE